MAGFTAWLLACGPFLTPLPTIQAIKPSQPIAYARGEVGIVRPRFARRYLVQAYRRFAGRPATSGAGSAPVPSASSSAGDREPSPIRQWAALQDSLLGTKMSAEDHGDLYARHFKHLPGGYAEFVNCPDAAFSHALRTARARTTRFGEASPEMREWARAQAAVFANCHDDKFVMPDAALPSAGPLLRADRAYQIAAAYFYGMQFEQAETWFHAIATDASSPWRPYGRYLAARANIRRATILHDTRARAAEWFGKAATDLQRVLADPAAAEIHRSARGLLDFIAFRIHPIERLHAVSNTLTTASEPAEQDVIDYTRLMDTFVGDTVDYDYTGVDRRAEIIQSDELNDWILAVQGRGDAALARSLARWKETRSTPWLIAALWKMPPGHQDASTVLDAARAIDRNSPAFPTAAFLRVRLLTARQNRDEARALLATLPDKPERGFEAETINLLEGERFMLAQTFDELLRSAPRLIVVDWTEVGRDRAFDQPVFDDDAGVVFSERLPLERLVQASSSILLPNRLRLRVAIAAFSRAVMLQRHDVAGRLAPVLRTLAPSLRADLDRFANATSDADRRIAAAFLLLRTPGMHADVRGVDDDQSYDAAEPARTFDHTFRRNWWCGLDEKDEFRADSVLLGLLYPDHQIPYPAFLSDAERTDVEQERRARGAIGPAAAYLAVEATNWARARPKDQDAAEALAHAVEGIRWSCGVTKGSQVSRQAYQTLHRLFPQSEWAKRTKYWY
jgi:hypothetical protein